MVKQASAEGQQKPQDLEQIIATRTMTLEKARAELSSENARLFNETQRLLKETEERNAELAVINSVQAALAAELDFQAIVALIGDKLREVLNSGDIGIRWYDKKANLIIPMYEYEHGEKIHVDPGTPQAGGLFDQMRKERKPLVFKTSQEQLDFGIFAVPGTDMAKSGAFIPIITNDEVVGQIIIEDHERENAFGESELRLLTTIAASLGTVLENARSSMKPSACSKRPKNATRNSPQSTPSSRAWQASWICRAFTIWWAMKFKASSTLRW